MKKIIINKEMVNSKAQALGKALIEGENISSSEIYKSLVKSVKSGEYKLSYKRIALIVLLAIVYIISPYDLVPEMILGLLGVTDDLGVAIFAIREILKLEKRDYIKWLKSNNIVDKQKELYA